MCGIAGCRVRHDSGRVGAEELHGAVRAPSHRGPDGLCHSIGAQGHQTTTVGGDRLPIGRPDFVRAMSVSGGLGFGVAVRPVETWALRCSLLPNSCCRRLQLTQSAHLWRGGT